MAAEYCSMASCGLCGRCDASWDREPEDDPRDEHEEEFDASLLDMPLPSEEAIRRANNDELYIAAVRRWFRQTDVA